MTPNTKLFVYNNQLPGNDQCTGNNVLKATVKGINNEWLKQIPGC